jgi:hypothetical protein
MESTAARPAIDIASERPRPGLALLLGVLSLPGSTIAWALPLGGLWIGLPLGVAAIVLALRARRRPLSPAGSRMAIGAIVLAALAIGQMVVYSIVSAVS